MQYLVSVERDGGTLRLRLAGEIDLAADEGVRNAILDAVTSDATHVVVDLGSVTFLDCAGISALVYGRRLAGERSQTFDIRNAQGMPLTMLRLAGIIVPPPAQAA